MALQTLTAVVEIDFAVAAKKRRWSAFASLKRLLLSRFLVGLLRRLTWVKNDKVRATACKKIK